MAMASRVACCMAPKNFSLLRPTQAMESSRFTFICRQAGITIDWDSTEMCDVFPEVDGKRSKVYIFGIKSQDQTSRYGKFRGMTLAGIYNDQTEELPEDFSLELRLRLRQPGLPHQLIFSPNPPNVTHWLAQQFPADNRLANRRHYAISIHENAHNLPPALLQAALMAYPESHAKHRSVILGLRGMNVTGEMASCCRAFSRFVSQIVTSLVGSR